MTPSLRKAFVLDTNVILHDSNCIKSFAEHEVIIPITVLEELDHFKKGNESINFHAREFLRSLDSLTGSQLFTSGVAMGEGLGPIRVEFQGAFHADLGFLFSSQKPDHQILNCAYTLARQNPETRYILVSKDVNLRMKAKAVGLQAEDYTTDRVKDVSQLYTGKRLLEYVPTEVIDTLYEESVVDVDMLELEEPLLPHENLILRNDKKSALAIYDPFMEKIRHIQKVPVYNIVPRNAEQTFALQILLNPDIPLVSITGKAGTGKTLLALAGALQQHERYRQIYLARPIVPLSNKDIGYLPGEIKQKIEPYMQPLYDNLGVIQNEAGSAAVAGKKIAKMQEDEKLVISALSYIRGRSLTNIFFIVDEAQNLTPHEVKTIITRAGEGSKIVLTGDVFQIDHPYLDAQSNGLSVLIEKMKGQQVYAHINLEKGERSSLAELASHIL